MWGAKEKQRDARIDTLIGRNTEVIGDIAFSGGLHVDGRVNGAAAIGGIDPAVFLTEGGSTEAEGGNLETGASERLVAHANRWR